MKWVLPTKWAVFHASFWILEYQLIPNWTGGWGARGPHPRWSSRFFCHRRKICHAAWWLFNFRFRASSDTKLVKIRNAVSYVPVINAKFHRMWCCLLMVYTTFHSLVLSLWLDSGINLNLLFLCKNKIAGDIKFSCFQLLLIAMSYELLVQSFVLLG